MPVPHIYKIFSNEMWALGKSKHDFIGSLLVVERFGIKRGSVEFPSFGLSVGESNHFSEDSEEQEHRASSQ